ncbi:MAG: aminotransferase class V-fold PLP-dependent enzyme [Mariprofundaceae bacterium]|nr:aminotransferase class V-fold PLP-dependent enzyme [Mariprofundaceae bacterium]
MHDEFPQREGLVYLNHAAVGVWPRRTAETVRRFADENMRQGAASYPQWMQVEQSLRRRFSRLIGAPSSSDIALVKNTSEGLSFIASGLEWQACDNIVSLRQEFPSNRMVWQALEDQGVELRLIDLQSSPDPEAAIMQCCDARTRIISVSSVQYASGLRMDINRLGLFCRREGVLFCVDAIQSLGALEFDVTACAADFVVADGHKWMFGPEGVAVFYSRPEAREQLALHQFGWHMAEKAGDFDAEDWSPAESARRFEPGSPNMLGIHALNASLSLLEDTGMEVIEAELLKRTRRLIELVDGVPSLELLSSRITERLSGIVSFRRTDLDTDGHAALYSYLMGRDVICALRGGGIRFSPHFYTPIAQLELALSIVADFKPVA